MDFHIIPDTDAQPKEKEPSLRIFSFRCKFSRDRIVKTTYPAEYSPAFISLIERY